jgi:hypothetical protein
MTLFFFVATDFFLDEDDFGLDLDLDLEEDVAFLELAMASFLCKGEIVFFLLLLLELLPLLELLLLLLLLLTLLLLSLLLPKLLPLSV